jgi:hypothetical protein
MLVGIGAGLRIGIGLFGLDDDKPNEVPSAPVAPVVIRTRTTENLRDMP